MAKNCHCERATELREHARTQTRKRRTQRNDAITHTDDYNNLGKRKWRCRWVGRSGGGYHRRSSSTAAAYPYQRTRRRKKTFGVGNTAAAAAAAAALSRQHKEPAR